MAILQGARITGSIIATSFIKATGFSGSLTASNLYVLGKAGIGTTSPSAKLTIVDNTNGGTINLVGRTSDDTAAINFRATGDGSTYAYVAPDTNEFRLYHNDGFMSFYPGGTEKVRITSTGNVGIGTTSPAQKLSINNGSAGGSGAVYPIRLSGGTMSSVNDATGIQFVQRDANNDYGGYIRLLTTQATPTYLNPRLEFGVQDTNTNVLGSVTTKMVITGDGNVGIGTTSPSSAASFNKVVEAYDATSLSYQVNSGGTYKAEFGISSNGGWLGTSTTHDMRFVSNGTERMRITSGGNVGIGTTSPSSPLTVQSNANQLRLQTQDAPTTIFANIAARYDTTRPFTIEVANNNSTAAEFMGVYADGGGLDNRVVFPTGNVGIGTTSPLTKLDVRSGYITAGTGTSTSGTTIIGGYYVNGNLTILGTEYSSGGPMLGYGVTPSTGSTGAFFSSTGINIYRSAYIQDGSTHRWYTGPVQTVVTGNPVTMSEKMRMDTNGNVGIGTTSPGYTLEVNGTQRVVGNFYLFNTVVNPASNFANQRGVGFEASTGKLEVAASGSNALSIGRFGSTGQILDFRYAGTQIGNFSLDTNDLTLATARHLILSPTGNVGIGTTSPKQSLTIFGEISLRNNDAYYWNAYYSSGFKYIGTGYAGYTIIDSTGAYTINTTNSSGTADAVASMVTRMYISSSGNVGIGTTSPLTKLNLSGGSGAVYQTFTDTTNAYHHGYIGKNGGGLVFGFSSQNGSFSADEKMRIDTTGNVGIGTTTVGNKLTVTTSTQYDGYYLRNVNGVVGTMLGVSATNDDGTVGLYSSTVLKTNITANGVSYFNGGSVGIGTSTPSYKLHISGAAQTILGIDSATTTNVAQFQAKANGDGVLISGIFGTTSVGNNYGVAAASQAYVGTTTLNTGYPSSLVIGNVSSIPIAFSTNNTERMRIDGSGNVGIGTSSPSYKLDVAGGIKIGGEETLPFAIGSMYLSYNSAINRIYYGDGTGYDLRFSKRGAGATTDFVTFKDTGNVGIGTNSPVNKLHVSGSSTNLPLKLEGLTSNATGYFLTVDNTTGVVYKSTGGANGTSGTSGANGGTGSSGTSGANGGTGSSGISGSSGTSGASGASGTSGTSGTTNIKAWVHFDGTGTPTINASLNVSSITDNNTGDYTINFTTAFANANYVVAGTVTYEYENPGQSINNMFIAVPRRPTAQLAGSCRISTPGSDNALYDCKYVRVLFSN